MTSEPRRRACTLGASELADRGAAWREVLGSGLVERTRIAGGIKLVAAPRVVAALTALIDLERECCTWIDYRVPEPSTFLLTADGDGQKILAGMFVADPAGRIVL